MMSAVTTAAAYGAQDFMRDLRAVAAQHADLATLVERIRPLARRLALSRGWLEPRHCVPDETQGFGIHVLHEKPDHSVFVFVAAWLPGRGVAPHNHGTWAVVAGVDGEERNIFWAREDDGSRPGFAKLRKVHEQVFGPGDVVALLPGVIHSVVNDTSRVTVSLHVYGFNLNLTPRSQFDPERDVEEPVVLKMN
jgi:predicted metal-dependent enzyme (double-stranded beta helix superfamily)